MKNFSLICWMVMASAFVFSFSACSDAYQVLDGEIEKGIGADTVVVGDTVAGDTVILGADIIDAEVLSCNFVELQEETVELGEELRLTKPANMNAHLSVTYRKGNVEFDTIFDRNYVVTNVVKINNYESIQIASIDSLKTVSLKKGAFTVGTWVIPASIENHGEALVYGPRNFTSENNSLCGVEIVSATLSFGTPELVEGTTYKVPATYTFTMSEGGEWSFTYEHCLVYTTADEITNYRFFYDEFVMEGADLFSLIKYQIEYTVSAPADAECMLNRNLTISDNGKIYTSVDASALENGNVETVVVSEVSSDTTAGERTSATYEAKFGGEKVKVEVSVDSKMSWRGNALKNAEISFVEAKAELIDSKMDGIYLVKTYNLITVWSVAGETIENVQEAEVKVIGLEPTFEGYTITRADVTLVYRAEARQPGQGITFLCGVAHENDGTGNKYFAINVAEYNKAYNGDVAEALKKSITVWDNVNLKNLENKCSALYTITGNLEPADMKDNNDLDFTAWNQSSGWDYLSLLNGNPVGFYKDSTFGIYPNPFISNVVATNGVFNYGDIYLLSDNK